MFTSPQFFVHRASRAISMLNHNGISYARTGILSLRPPPRENNATRYIIILFIYFEGA